ncbi:MAG: D-alanine--D-alanine ligase [Phycisphaerales bacterium]|nr:MAG: D-alanine--D-alanine ligase [Phycisphaerales bacterium]
MLDITVLAGGPSDEREVSLASGHAVYDALCRLGHRVELRDIGPENLSALDRPADFVFVALHGEFGEDGTVQTELERRHLPYSGTRAEASRVAMNKVASKRRFESAGVSTPPYEIVERDNLATLASRFGVPAVAKPISSGSSVDTWIVRTPADLTDAASRVVDKYGSALVERYIAGPELTVGILGTEALPVCEIRTKREFYDYDAKYVDDDTQYLLDPDLPPELIDRVRSMSLIAHEALGCRVFSRVDWMVDANDQEPYVLEVNTIPGFTSHSLLPKAAARVGLDFDQLCQRIVELSMLLDA